MSWKQRIGEVRYRPNSDPRPWLISEDSVQYLGAAVRHTHSAPTDVTISLRRRPGAQEAKDPNWYKRRRAPLSVPPLALEIAQPLPPVCTAHGRAAVSQLLMVSVFYETGAHPRFPNATSRANLHPPPASTTVRGEWPVCDRCTRKRRWYHGIAGVLILVMALNLFAMLVVARVLEYEPLVMPLAIGVFPGSFPLGLLLVFVLLNQGNTRMKLRPIDDERFLRVDAHPRFAAALQKMSPRPPSEQLPSLGKRVGEERGVPDRPAPDESTRPRHATEWGQ